MCIVVTIGRMLAALLWRTEGWTALLIGWLAFFAFAYVLLIRPRVVVDAHGLTIVNPIRRHRVPFGEVDRVGSPGYLGAPLVLADGKSITVWIGQKSNLALWAGWHSYGDDVAEELTRRIAAAQGLPFTSLASFESKRQPPH